MDTRWCPGSKSGQSNADDIIHQVHLGLLIYQSSNIWPLYQTQAKDRFSIYSCEWWVEHLLATYLGISSNLSRSSDICSDQNSCVVASASGVAYNLLQCLKKTGIEQDNQAPHITKPWPSRTNTSHPDGYIFYGLCIFHQASTEGLTALSPLSVPQGWEA